MNPTYTASNSIRESSICNLRSSSNALGGNVFKRIKLTVNKLALAMYCAKRIPDNNQPATQNQSRNLQTCSDMVAKAIEVLIGSDTAASPQSMYLSPVEINSTVNAFAGYLGHGSALSGFHLVMKQSNPPCRPPVEEEIQNSLSCLGNSSPQRIQALARATLGVLVKNTPERTPNSARSDRSPSYAEFAKNLGPSAVGLLKALNDNTAEAGVISTRTDLSIDQLTVLFQILVAYVDTLPINAPQRVEALQFAQHIEGKIIEVGVVRAFDPRQWSAAAELHRGHCVDFDVMKAMVTVHGFYLQFASPALQNNLDLVMVAVQQHGIALEYASPELRNNPDVVMAAVQGNSWSLQFASPALQNNPYVVMAAVQQNGFTLELASPALQGNLDMVMAAVQQNGSVLELASPALQNNLDVVMAAVQQYGYALRYASATLQDNLSVVMAAVQQSGWALQFVSPALQNHPAVLMAAVQQNGWALVYADQASRNNLGVVMAAVQQNGWAIQFASPTLRNNLDVVMAAVQQKGLTLQHASDQVRNHPRVVMTAVQQNGMALEFASPALRNKLDIVLAAMRQNGRAREFASLALQNNLNMIGATRPQEI